MRLDIVVASNALETVLRLHQSFSCLDTIDIHCYVLLFDQKQDLLLKHPQPNNLHIFECHQRWLFIHESRNRCQKKLQQLMIQHSSIGMVLDDDKKWFCSQDNFLSLIKVLKEQNIDMAFCQDSGDAPIPAEYTRTSPLLDIILSLNQHYPLEVSHQLSNYVAEVQCAPVTSITIKNAHHDFYSFTPEKFATITIEKTALADNLNHWLKAMLYGKSSTRSLENVKAIRKATGRERGGATLILNSNLLYFPNIAMTLPPLIFGRENRVSRRSDMVMAMCCKQAGYKLAVAPSLLIHNRPLSKKKSEPNKLHGDILGYALVNYLENRYYFKAKQLEHPSFDYFYQTFIKRYQKTTVIIEASIILSHLLLENIHLLPIKQPALSKQHLKNIISESQQATKNLIIPDKKILEEAFLQVLKNIDKEQVYSNNAKL
jgi:hypothetical protein